MTKTLLETTAGPGCNGVQFSIMQRAVRKQKYSCVCKMVSEYILQHKML